MRRGAAASDRPWPNPWIVAPAAALPAFLVLLDFFATAAILPRIAGAFGITPDAAGWLVAANAVAAAIALLFSGWFAAAVGRRRGLLFGLAVYTAGAALSGLAAGPGTLLIGRALQGLAGGVILPLAQSILTGSLPPLQRGRAFAIFAAALTVAPLVASPIAAWLAEAAGWPALLLAQLPAGLLLLLLVSRLREVAAAPRSARARRRSRVAIKTPAVDLPLFGLHNFAVANLLLLLFGFVLAASAILLPFDASGRGPIGMALLLLPVAGIALGGVDARWLALAGLLLAGAALLLVIGLELPPGDAMLVWLRPLQSLGLVLLFVPINLAAVIAVPARRMTGAFAMGNLARHLGVCLAFAVLGNTSPPTTAVDGAGVHVALSRLTGILSRQGDSAAMHLRQAELLLRHLVQEQAGAALAPGDLHLLAAAFVLLVALLFLLRRADARSAERS